MSEGFANPIIGGGGGLVYPSIHSPDFVEGTTGWSIDKNGNAEFNSLQLLGGGVQALVVIGGVTYAISLNQVGALMGMEVAAVTAGDAPYSPAGVFAESSTANAQAFLVSGQETALDVAATIDVLSALASGIANGRIDLGGGLINLSAQGQVNIGSPIMLSVDVATGVITVTNQASALVVDVPVTATAGTNSNPTLITTDIWRNLILDPGWTSPALSRQAPRYRLTEGGNIQFNGACSQAAWAGGKPLNSNNPLGAPYVPPDPVDYYSSDSVGNRAHISYLGVSSATPGVLVATLPAGAAGTWNAEINGIVPLT